MSEGYSIPNRVTGNTIGINDHGYFVAGHYSPEGDPFDPKEA